MKGCWGFFWMGVWLAGTVVMAVVATQNFFTIDRLLAGTPNPSFHAAVQHLGNPDARDLLRYFASELNRLYFLLWNLAQLPIGILVLWLVARDRAPARVKWGVVVMLGLVLVMAVGLMPAIRTIGRGLDFTPREPPPPSLATFGLIHAAYTTLDFIKLGLGIVVSIWIHRAAAKLRTIEAGR